MTDDDYEDMLETIAEDYGVETDTVESMADVLGIDLELLDDASEFDLYAEIGGGDMPDADYMEGLAELLDMDVHDLYDMYYGYND